MPTVYGIAVVVTVVDFLLLCLSDYNLILIV